MTFTRHSVVDLSQLPEFSVVEVPDVEVRLRARMLELKRLWSLYDPPLGAAYDVEDLEFDPIKIEQEMATNFDIGVLTRINHAARAITLAFSSGTDIDVVASRYPGGVPRLPSEIYDEGDTPVEKAQKDARFKRRVQLIPNTLSPHGVDEAYAYYALTGLEGAKDAAVISEPGKQEIAIPVMMGMGVPPEPTITRGKNFLYGKLHLFDPRPTDEQLNIAQLYVNSEDRRSATDVPRIMAPIVIDTKISLELTLFEGPDESLILDSTFAAVYGFVLENYWLGYDLVHMAIMKAVAQRGVQNAQILEPVADIRIQPTRVVRVTDINLRIIGRAE